MMRQNLRLESCNDALGLEYNLHLHINRPTRCRYTTLQSLVIMLIGLVVGFMATNCLKNRLYLRSPCERDCCRRHISTWIGMGDVDQTTESFNTPTPNIEHTYSTSKLVYVGVMTAEKYLNTRARAVHHSWARSIPGKVEFFTSAKGYNQKLPIVNLPGVDDSVYPPQKKSFMMLKYMYDNYIDEYEWFVRADDDVYIHGTRLGNFLHSLNSSMKHYLGQAGQGIDSEQGRIGLEALDNYCMGGTTMIFSRATLKEMVPQINFCIKNLVSIHEDVEIGRCVSKFAGTSCPWAFEFRNLFYQNHDERNGSFTKPGTLRKLVKPITMHPVKDSKHLHRMHGHFLDDKIREIRFKNLELYRDIRLMSTLLGSLLPKTDFPATISLDKFHPEFAEDVLSWIYFDKNYYSHKELSVKHSLPKSLFQGIDAVVSETMRLINWRARELGRHIDFRGLLYGYWRVDPLHSADYITDLLLSYHKHRGKHVKVPVRRHSYLHQPFTEPEIRISMSLNQLIYFIVPVFQRENTLTRFIKNFEEVCLQNKELVHLVLVNYNNDESSSMIESSIKSLKLKYLHARVDILKGSGNFSRARALQQGATFCVEDALLFFIDLDIHFNRASLQRIRENTVRQAQAYFPIVFSQYNPDIVCNYTNTHCLDDDFLLSESRGYWRHFGFGIASIYREDFLTLGGFNLKITGWGKEDVEFYEKVLNSSLAVVRAPDTGMVHIYHSVHCADNLPQVQLNMCQGTMRSNYAPQAYMTDFILENSEIFDKENV